MALDPKISLMAAIPRQNLRGLGSLGAAEAAGQIALAQDLEMQELAKTTAAAFDMALAQRNLRGLGRGGFGVIEPYQKSLYGLAAHGSAFSPPELRGIGALGARTRSRPKRPVDEAADKAQEELDAETKKKRDIEEAKKTEKPEPKNEGFFSSLVKGFLGEEPKSTGGELGAKIAGAFQLTGNDKKKADAKNPIDGKAKLGNMIGGTPSDVKMDLGIKVSADPITAAIIGASAGAAYAAVEYIGKKLDQFGAMASCSWKGFEFCDPQGALNAAKFKFVDGLLSPLTPAALDFLTGPQLGDEVAASKACDHDKPGQFGCGWPDKAEASDNYVGNSSIINYRIKRLQNEADLRMTVGCFNKDELQAIKRTAALTGMLSFIGAQTTDAALDILVFSTNLNWAILTEEQKTLVQTTLDRQLARVQKNMDRDTGGGGGGGGGQPPAAPGLSPAVMVGIGVAAVAVIGIGIYAMKKPSA